MTREKPKETGAEHSLIDPGKELILYNDEINSFDFVIDTLIEVCEQELLQAEQCTYIAHYKGKCTVKYGILEELKPKMEEMSRRGLTVSID